MGVLSSGISSENLTFVVRFLILIATALVSWLEPYFLPKNSVGGLMAILAQGHFLLGYLYQYKTGKINQDYAIRYVPFAILLFGVGFLGHFDKLLETAAATYFLIHFFYDERYLLREKADFSGWRIALPTICLLTAEIVYRFAGVHSVWLPLGAFALSAIYMSWLILLEIFHARSLSRRSTYFLVIFSIASALTLSGKVLPGPVNLNAINFIILMHIGNWYWRYFVKFFPDRARLKRFFLETIAVNTLMGTLMFFRFHASLSFPLSGFAGIFFLHPYFHVWSLLHFVATYRSTDIMNWVPIAGNRMVQHYGSTARQ